MVLIALRREMSKGLGGCPLGHTVTAFTNKNSNTHRHQSGHSHSALDSQPPLLGTERGTGSGRMRYLCRPEGRLADASFNSGPASGCREVNGAEERWFTSLFPGYQACPSPCSFHCNHIGSGTGSTENQGGAGGCKCRKAASL